MTGLEDSTFFLLYVGKYDDNSYETSVIIFY